MVNRRWIRDAVSYLTAIFVFVLILQNRSPNFLRPLSINIQFGYTIVVPILFIVLYFSFRMRGWLGKLISLTITLSLFALALAGIWASGHTQSTIISGLIPLNDAQNYYLDALRLLAGRAIQDFSAARPLFADILATLLALTNRNLMSTIAVLTAINGLACYFAAKEIQHTHGDLAATFLLIFLFLYYRHRTVGTVMSENLGLPLGILGVTLIWRSIANGSPPLMLFGLFISTVALNARPGALFTLPVLLLWGSWCFRKPNKNFSSYFFLLGTGTIGAGFILNLLIMRLIGVSSGVPFSQFSYALYGLASGGNSWAYVFQIHPELAALVEPQKTQTIYKLTFELIRTYPSLVFRGAFYNWSMFFSNAGYNLFSFISGENYYANNLTRWGLYIFSGFGVMKWLKNKSDLYTNLVCTAAVGVLISVPFVPPADAYGMRLYAASIIIIGLLPTMGLVFLLEKLKIALWYKPNLIESNSQMSIWYGATLTVLLLIGPVMVKGISYIPQTTATSCPSGTDSIIIRLDPGSSINLIREKDFALDWMPTFHPGIFKRNAHGLPDNAFIERLESIPPLSTLFYALDYRSNRTALIIVSTALLPQPGTITEMCGTWESNPTLTPYSIFLVNYAQAISN